jgi:DNA-binding transcriptional regulator YiaG
MMVGRPVTVVFEGAVAEPPLVEQQAAACGLRHDEAGQPVDSAGEQALGAAAEVGVAIPRQQADVVNDAVAGLQLQQCITAGVNTIDRTHAVIVQQATACEKCVFLYVLRNFQQFPVVCRLFQYQSVPLRSFAYKSVLSGSRRGYFLPIPLRIALATIAALRDSGCRVPTGAKRARADYLSFIQRTLGDRDKRRTRSRNTDCLCRLAEKGMRWSAIIKQIRVTRGLKQQALASLLGVSQSAVSRWENNQDEPNLAAAKQLLAMASPAPVGSLELFSAEAEAKFCPVAISTVAPLRLVRWNELLMRRWGLDPRPGDRLTGSWRARGSITIERAESARGR